MIKAAIFDVDGVIVNSEPIASLAYEALVKAYGKIPMLQKSGLFQPSGMRESEVLQLIKMEYGISEDIEELQRKRSNFYQNHVKTLKKMPGVTKLFDLLVEHKLILAVASSSTQQRINLKLSLTKTINYFSKVISAENIKNGKPHPDIFLEVAKQINVKPEDCVVFEDSENGVLAASKAGMKVIAVPTRYTKGHDFSKATIVVKSLNEITWKMITNL